MACNEKEKFPSKCSENETQRNSIEEESATSVRLIRFTLFQQTPTDSKKPKHLEQRESVSPQDF